MVVLLFPMGAKYDIVSYDLVSDAVLSGKNVYAVLPERYPYFPGWMVIEGICKIISNNTPFPFWFVIRLPQIIADVSLVYLVYKITSNQTAVVRLSPLQAATIHTFNPVAIAIIAGHGQFDSLPILGLILAIVLLKIGRYDLSAVALGLGIALKPVPAFMGLLFLAKRPNLSSRLRYFALAALPTTVLSLPFLIWNPTAFVGAVVGYKSDALMSWLTVLIFSRAGLELFGLNLPAIPASLITSLTKYVFMILTLIISAYYWKNERKHTLFGISLAIFLLFYVVSSAVAAQYPYWAMPLLLLVRLPNWYRLSHILSSFSASALWYTKSYALDGFHSPIGYVVIALFLLSVLAFWFTSAIGLYILFQEEIESHIKSLISIPLTSSK